MSSNRILIYISAAYIVTACTSIPTPAATIDLNPPQEQGAAVIAPDEPDFSFDVTPTFVEGLSPPAFTLRGDMPVLARGRTWDSAFVFPGAVVFHDGLLHMFYQGSRGLEGELPLNSIGYAVSLDGYVWQRALDDPVQFSGEPDYSLRSLEISSVLVEPDGTWVMYFTAWLEGGLFRSGVGRANAPDPTGPWTFAKSLALLTDNPERWDGSRIFSPQVIRTATEYVMYYTGVDVNPRNPALQIGRATSTDGITWTKYDDPETTGRRYEDSDPVLKVGQDSAWDATNVSNPQVLRTAENWLMVYRGSFNESLGARTPGVGFAASPEGIHWERFEGNPVFLPQEVMPDFFFSSPVWLYFQNQHFLYFSAYDVTFSTQEIYLAISQ